MALDHDELNKRRQEREKRRKRRQRAMYIKLALAVLVLIGCGVGIFFLIQNNEPTSAPTGDNMVVFAILGAVALAGAFTFKKVR